MDDIPHQPPTGAKTIIPFQDKPFSKKVQLGGSDIEDVTDSEASSIVSGRNSPEQEVVLPQPFSSSPQEWNHTVTLPDATHQPQKGDVPQEIDPVKMTALENRKALELVHQFSEEEPAIDGSSPFAHYAQQCGVTTPMIRDFESYRNQALQAYHEGKDDLASEWGKAARDVQESIEYAISANHTKGVDTVGDLAICYHGAAHVMHQSARSRAALLKNQVGVTVAYDQYDKLVMGHREALEAANLYDKALEAFQLGDRREGQRLQYRASYHQRAATALEKYVEADTLAHQAALDGKNKEYKKQKTLADKFYHEASTLIQGSLHPTKARQEEEKTELLEVVRRFTEEEEVDDGNSFYAEDALKQGASASLVRAFESYRSKAVTAYQAGNHDEAVRWAKIAEDAQEGIEYDMEAFQHAHDFNMFHCYRGAAKAIVEMAKSQADFLTLHSMTSQSEGLISLGVQAEYQFVNAVETYKKALQFIKAGDREGGMQLQEKANRERFAAHCLEKSIEYHRKILSLPEGTDINGNEQHMRDYQRQIQVFSKLALDAMRDSRKNS